MEIQQEASWHVKIKIKKNNIIKYICIWFKNRKGNKKWKDALEEKENIIEENAEWYYNNNMIKNNGRNHDVITVTGGYWIGTSTLNWTCPY